MDPARPDIALVSLGCPKNLVDSECMSGILEGEGYRLVPDPDDADVIVVNTCGFIESAKREAIDTILAMADRKAPVGRCRFLVVTGCLAQRYPQEILDDLPEVDAVLGTSAYGRIAEAVRRLEADPTRFSDCGRGDATAHLGARRRVSTGGYAYLKVAEGCSNRCAYCAIPDIRGPFVSRPFDELLEEARRLVADGSDELVLVAQDTTRYGLDAAGKRLLPDLLRALAGIDGVRLLRILYAYPDGVDEALLDEMARNPKVARYLDIPVQHASDLVLRRMNRRGGRAEILATLEALRARVPGIVLRSTLLVGFPGETEQDYEELLSFVDAARFDRLGAFVFSPEEGTPAATMRPKVPKRTAERRLRGVMERQLRIAREKGREALGTERLVRIESVDEDGVFYLGRSEGEAPEIDPPIHVVGTAGPLAFGQLVRVRIVDAGDHELTGATVE
jgi:ribosomal protein S12 methylthiotransferase